MPQNGSGRWGGVRKLSVHRRTANGWDKKMARQLTINLTVKTFFFFRSFIYFLFLLFSHWLKVVRRDICVCILCCRSGEKWRTTKEISYSTPFTDNCVMWKDCANQQQFTGYLFSRITWLPFPPLALFYLVTLTGGISDFKLRCVFSSRSISYVYGDVNHFLACRTPLE